VAEKIRQIRYREITAGMIAGGCLVGYYKAIFRALSISGDRFGPKWPK
jgi:hypothetical protein